jgi:hypothetical protein
MILSNRKSAPAGTPDTLVAVDRIELSTYGL